MSLSAQSLSFICFLDVEFDFWLSGPLQIFGLSKKRKRTNNKTGEENRKPKSKMRDPK